jgi:hypothetical protein
MLQIGGLCGWLFSARIATSACRGLGRSDPTTGRHSWSIRFRKSYFRNINSGVLESHERTQAAYLPFAQPSQDGSFGCNEKPRPECGSRRGEWVVADIRSRFNSACQPSPSPAVALPMPPTNAGTSFTVTSAWGRSRSVLVASAS